jgi:serine phosphatase RsbU (regulator of sigma subunit)
MAAPGSRPSPSRKSAASSRLASSNKSASSNIRKGASRGGKAKAGSGKGKSSGKTSAKGKGQKTQKAQARRSKNDGSLQAIPSPGVGFPLWIKFAIPTAFIITLLLVVEGFVISRQMVQSIEDQINKRGVDLVTQLAQNAPSELWKKVIPEDIEPLPEDASVADKERFEKIIKNRNIEIKNKLKAEWNDRLQTTADNSRKNNKEGRKEIRAMLLLNYNKAKTSADRLASSNPDNESTSLSTSGAPIILGEVEIFKGLLSGNAVREFRIPIRDKAGDPIASYLNSDRYGWASVFLDSGAITDLRAKTNRNILIITILGAIASVIIIVLIATLFTRPIRILQADITRVAEGDLNHRTSVSTNDEIGALATVFNAMTNNLCAAQAQEVDRKALERELTIANEIQTKLLPERIPQIPGFDIARFYASAKEVGGDYYDFLVIDQRHLGIVVADVSGKGIPGSMVMTMVRSLLRLASVRNFSPADTFKKVNRILAKDIRRGMFVTAIYMVLDIVENKLKVASAGHNPLVVYRADSGKVELVKPKGIALGFDKGPIFDAHIREVEIELHRGDRITAFTDGVNEAMDKDDEEFGDENFYELVRQTANLNSEEFIDKIVAAIAQHRGDFEQSDDITLTTLSVLK